MKISVKAKPGMREDKVKPIDAAAFAVTTKEPPFQGRANRAICKLLAEFFKVAPSRVKIISGFTSRNKIIEIL